MVSKIKEKEKEISTIVKKVKFDKRELYTENAFL